MKRCEDWKSSGGTLPLADRAQLLSSCTSHVGGQDLVGIKRNSTRLLKHVKATNGDDFGVAPRTATQEATSTGYAVGQCRKGYGFRLD